MSNSIGDLKNSGLQGNNWPWQYRVLLGLDGIINALQNNGEDFEAAYVVEKCPGPPPTERVLLEVRIWDTTTNTWGTIRYYLPGSNTPIAGPVPAAGCTLEYVDASNIRPLTCTDQISVCTAGLPVDTSNPFPVSIVNSPLTVNTSYTDSSVVIYGYDGISFTPISVTGSGELNIRPLTCTDKVSLCFNDGVSDVTVSSANPLPVNAIVTVPTPLPVSQDPSSDPWTVDATDLDIRDLTFATDSVDVTGSDVTVSNTVTVQATALDIRPLTCADEVSLCTNGNTVDSSNPLPVDAGALTPSADGVGMYGSTDGGTNWTPVQVDTNGAVSTNTTIVGPLGNQDCDNSVAVSLCTAQALNLEDIKTAVEGTLDVNVLTIPEVEIKNDTGNPINVLQQYPATVPYASCEVATGTGTTPVVFSAGATSMSVQNLGNDNITVDTDASTGVILPPGVSITWEAPVGQRFDTFTFTGSSVSSLFIVTAVIAS